jgi:hypothetical protein
LKKRRADPAVRDAREGLRQDNRRDSSSVKRRRRRTEKRSWKVLTVQVFLIAILCTAAFAFTSGISFGGQGNAADGTAASVSISVATLVYELDPFDPSTIANVRLTFSGGTPGTARARIGAGAWTNDCVNSGGTFTCAWSTPPAIPANGTSLRVVATN